jgi:hypothetical protein
MPNTFRYQTQIGVLGLSQEEKSIIESFCPKGACVVEAKHWVDLVAGRVFIVFFRPGRMSTKELRRLCAYYADVGEAGEPAYAIMDEESIALRDDAKMIAQYPTFKLLEDQLKYYIEDAWRLPLKTKKLSISVAKAIQILSLIRRRPGISTKTMVGLLEMSSHSVKKHIEVLRVAGEWIEYDDIKRGWILSAGQSILWGDFEKR